VSLQSGLPFNVYNSSADYNGDGKNIDRPDFAVKGNPNLVAFNHNTSPADPGYLRTQYFVAPVVDPNINGGYWRDGNLGRNALSGPGYLNTDFTLTKIFRIKEHSNLQLQFNFFNIFNRTNFALPDGNMSSPSFGLCTATYGPRVGQFAARIDF
jgi:hypothetical protein